MTPLFETAHWAQLLSLPNLKIGLDPAWASTQKNHRQLLRTGILNAVQATAADQESILNLNRVPRPQAFKVSISHSPDLGGFALCHGEVEIGFDIENLLRIKTPIVARVSSKYELESAPFAAALWSAKESALKAVDHGQGTNLISEISISAWKNLSKNLWEYSATKSKTSLSLQGLIYKKDSLILGLCKFIP